MSNKYNIAILILAAGSSSRMNVIKQLLPWKGSTFIGNTIQVAKASLAQNIFVVLGANADCIQAECEKESVDYLINKDWQVGMGTSIAFGVRHLLQKEKFYDGVLILLCDQPFINTEYINELITVSKESSKNIIATKHEHGIGVPALFSKNYFKKLSILSKDIGAKEILKNEKSSLKVILPNFSTMDVDTETSYKKLKI